MSARRGPVGKLLVLLCCLSACRDSCQSVQPIFQSVQPIFQSVQSIFTEQMPRVETGMHTRTIRQIAVDVAGRFLVTGSYDKTVRVWDLQSGALLTTLRPPQRADRTDNEGMIYAVAMSPDGSTIAAGGLNRYQWDQVYSIYLFDRVTGRMLHQISGLPDVVLDLAFSQDGDRLAAVLGSGGLRVFQMPDGQRVGRDPDYGDRSRGVHFDTQGRIVTSSDDGYLRLYDRSLHLPPLKWQVPAGQKPSSIRFSPDGTAVAVGYVNSPRVDVLSGRDLHPLYSADVTGVDNGDLSSVAWSADGSGLCAGGAWSISGANRIRCWADQGQGTYKDTPSALNSISNLAALPDGRLAFSAADPAWGILDRQSQRVWFQPSYTADFRGNYEGFLVDKTGGQVRFGYAEFGANPAMFSVADHALILDSEPSAVLKPPSTCAPDIKVTGWQNTELVRLNSMAEPLVQDERSRSLAIAPDGRWFVLGTDRLVRCFDKSGTQRWQVDAPGAAWDVNISGDGKLVVAAFDDGTIRWYRADYRKELLAFFPHNDRKRWVAWTPAGFYDASPGGEDLIGWHVDHGPDQAADFLPASRFRDRFYRPDIIAKVLFTEEDDKTLATHLRLPPMAHILPPVARILSPQDGATAADSQLTLRVSLRSPSRESITQVQALIDGRPALTQPLSLPADTAEHEISLALPLPQGDATVAVFARTAASGLGEPAVVHLRRPTPAKPVPDFDTLRRPALYVLAVGVTTYQYPELNNLKLPAADAKGVADALQGQEGKLYRQVVVHLLQNEQAKKDEILDELEWLQRQTTSRDVAVLFLAGHGTSDPGTSQYYFLPYDANPEKITRTMLPDVLILNTLNKIAGKVVLLLDTCHSAGVLGHRQTRGQDPALTRLINELTSAENGVVVYTASARSQEAQEDPSWGHGAFTEAVIEALWARDVQGLGHTTRDILSTVQHARRLTVDMLSVYLSERVKELTNRKQTPVALRPPGSVMRDFPLAYIK